MGCRLAGIVGAVFLLFLLSTASAYEEVEVRNGGKIVGVVKITGEVQERKPLEVFKYKEVCGEQVPDESSTVHHTQNLSRRGALSAP